MHSRPYQVEIGPTTLVRERWGIDASPALWSTDTSLKGKAYARLNTPIGQLFLRRYPLGTSSRWLDAVHAAVALLEGRNFALFPRFAATESGETIVRHTGYLYDLSAWADGNTIEADALSEAQLTNLGASIAQLHLGGVGAGGPEVRFDWLNHRQRLVQRLAWDPSPRAGRQITWHGIQSLRDFLDPLIRSDAPTRGDRNASDVVEAAAHAMAWLEQRASSTDLVGESLTLTHGDLCIDHVKFTGERVSALLDLDTLALRVPTGDLAALFADFGQWNAARCRVVLSGYARLRPVTIDAIAALPRLGALRTLGVLRERLLAWLDDSRRNSAEASLDGPVPFWCAQLRTLAAMDPETFASATFP